MTFVDGMALLASIPSPSSNTIGPLRAYGLMIGLGVLAAIEITGRRWKERGGDPNDIWSIAVWAVPAGLVGARLYHVITDWKTYFGDGGRPIEALYLWQGGLGIPGGIILGTAVGAYVAHRRGMRLPPALDCVAVGFPVAEAIGRIGNYFNQEVFGRPTELPWGLEIDAAHRPSRFLNEPTFHPTFLYEGLWNLALAAFLFWFDRKRAIRPGNLFAMYVGGYALGRLWVEALRADNASLIFGVRINIWMSVLTLVGVGVVFVVRGFKRRPGDSDAAYANEADGPDATEGSVSSADAELGELG